MPAVLSLVLMPVLIVAYVVGFTLVSVRLIFRGGRIDARRFWEE
jgi:hypothetical protein